MSGLGNVVMIVGAGLVLVGQVWISIVAFRHGFLWFLAVFCIPFAALIFVILHFDETKGGLVAYVLGLVLSAGGASMVSRAERQRALLQQLRGE